MGQVVTTVKYSRVREGRTDTLAVPIMRPVTLADIQATISMIMADILGKRDEK